MILANVFTQFEFLLLFLSGIPGGWHLQE